MGFLLQFMCLIVTIAAAFQSSASAIEETALPDRNFSFIREDGARVMVRQIGDQAPVVLADGQPVTAGPAFDEAQGRMRNYAASQGNGYLVEFTQPPLAMSSSSGPDRINYKTTLENLHQRFASDLGVIRSKTSSLFSMQTEKKAPLDHTFSTVFNGVAVSLTDEERAAVVELSYVKGVFPDQLVQMYLNNSVPLIGASTVHTSYGYTGTGIVVAIIDTGVDYTHPDLGGAMGPSNKVIGGYDFINKDADPKDDHGHGTHVAGIVAANGTMKGVAPGAKLLAYKVLDYSGSGVNSDVIAAIERACDPDQNPATNDAADVINMSLGGLGMPDDPVSLATDAASALGVVCVVAAGNSYGYETIGSPGCARNAITVGASDITDRLAEFSSRGPVSGCIKPELLAPGYYVQSLALGSGTTYMSGTSMAAPHIAGAAALILQGRPTFTPAQVKSTLMNSSLDVGLDTMTQGAGRVNVYRALGGPPLVTNPPSVHLVIDNSEPSTWTGSRSISIYNPGPGTRSLSFSVDTSRLPAGLDASITPTMTLTSGSTATATVSFTVDNAAVQNLHEAPYIYYGDINARYNSGEVKRIPFALAKEQPDTMEPNDIPAQASPIIITEQRREIRQLGQTRIEPDGATVSSADVDWYRFEAKAGRKLFVYVEASEIGSAVVADLKLYSSSLVLLKSGYRVTSDPRIVFFTIPADGTYYLKVSAPYGYGMYRILAHYLPPEVKFTYGPQLPQGGYPVIGAAFSNSGDYLYAGQNYNHYLQLFRTDGSGVPVYALTGNTIYDGLDRVAGFGASANGSLFAGVSNITFGSIEPDQDMDLYQTPSSAVTYHQRFSPPRIRSSLPLDDGTKLITLTESGIDVYSPAGALIKTIPHAFSTLSRLVKVSSDGSFALVDMEDGDYSRDYELLDLQTGGSRTLPTAPYGYIFTMSGDASRIVMARAINYVVEISAHEWNGNSYVPLWQRSISYEPSFPAVYGVQMASNGSLVGLAIKITGGGLSGDSGTPMVLLNGSDGTLLTNYRPPKDPTVGLQTWTCNLSINDEGTLAAFSSTGGDRRTPEVFVFSPKCSTPVFELGTTGSAWAMDVIDNRVAIGDWGRHANLMVHPNDCGGALYMLDLSGHIQDPPPNITEATATPHEPAPNSPVLISCRASDDTGVGTVEARIQWPDQNDLATLPLYDDGLHGDGAASDGVYANTWTTKPLRQKYLVDFVASDQVGHSATFDNAANFTVTSDSRIIYWSAAASSAAEKNSTVQIPVKLNIAAPAEGVTVEYRIIGGTATEGEDYTLNPGLLTFTPNSTQSAVPLTIKYDKLTEANETVVLELFNASNAMTSSSMIHTVTINDRSLTSVRHWKPYQ